MNDRRHEALGDHWSARTLPEPTLNDFPNDNYTMEQLDIVVKLRGIKELSQSRCLHLWSGNWYGPSYALATRIWVSKCVHGPDREFACLSISHYSGST